MDFSLIMLQFRHKERYGSKELTEFKT